MSDAQGNHRALVFGATGYTGAYLVRRLRNLGVETYAHLRPSSSKKSTLESTWTDLGANVCLVDWDAPAIDELVANVRPTLVFAVLGSTRARMKSLKKQGAGSGAGSYEAVDYGLTAMAHRACEKLDGPVRFVYLSSLGVKEGTRVPYLAVRWKMERELREGKSDWTVVRPGFITGSDREEFRFGERAGAIVSDGLLALTGWVGGKRLRQQYRSITGEELAAGMIKWAMADEGKNRVVTTIDLWERA